MAAKTQDIAVGIDQSMTLLRRSMRGVQIRTAGFRKDHDELARAVSNLTVTLLDAQALLASEKRRNRRR